MRSIDGSLLPVKATQPYMYIMPLLVERWISLSLSLVKITHLLNMLKNLNKQKKKKTVCVFFTVVLDRNEACFFCRVHGPGNIKIEFHIYCQSCTPTFKQIQTKMNILFLPMFWLMIMIKCCFDP